MEVSTEAEGAVEVGARRRTRSSSIDLEVNSPDRQNSVRSSYSVNVLQPHALGLRSEMTTPQRSKTALSLLRSKSRSVVPDAVPVGIRASFTESWIMRDCEDAIELSCNLISQ